MALELGSVCVILTPHFIEISVFTAVVGAHNSAYVTLSAV